MTSAHKPEDIEDILRHRYPHKLLAETLATSLQSVARSRGESDPEAAVANAHPQIARIEAARRELLELPPEEVARMATAARAALAAAEAAAQARRHAVAKAKAEAKEAARFYNQPSATADYAFWAKAESWTVDDSAALLLGKDPRVVTHDALKRELATGTGFMQLGAPPGRSAFHAAYDNIRALLERALSLNGSRLIPRDVLTWAQRTGATPIPADLLAALPPSLAVAPVTAPTVDSLKPPAGAEGAQARQTGTNWSPQELAEMRAFKATHGTSATAAKYGISPARVRKLAPSTTQPAKVGNALDSWLRPKR